MIFLTGIRLKETKNYKEGGFTKKAIFGSIKNRGFQKPGFFTAKSLSR
jgi:hypothetical protein